MELLRTNGLVKSYHRRRVVNEVDIFVRRGEIVGLLGPNGAGKTTTFSMIVGLVRPDRGKIIFDNRDITSLSMWERARLGISYLSQEPSVFRKLSVENNIMAILEFLPLTYRERKKRLHLLLDELNIGHLAKNKAYTLSGGERRRLEITRALVISPSFILLDEPFSGVDPISVLDVQQIISNLSKKGLGILLTDHNARETLGSTHRAYLIREGKVFLSGKGEELVKDKKAREFYLGHKFRM